MSILALRVDREESKLQFFLSGLQATSKKKKKSQTIFNSFIGLCHIKDVAAQDKTN